MIEQTIFQNMIILIIISCIIFNQMGKKGKGKKQAREEQQEDKNQQEVTEPKEQEQQNNQQNEKKQEEKPKVEVVQPRKIQYCPMCTFPFELCKYGKKASECKKFLMEIAPTKVSKYHPELSEENQKLQAEREKAEKAQQPAKQKKERTVKDKYILIDVKERTKKKFISDVSGLSNFNIDPKELAKKLCKKFACSCSPVDNDKITVQGDFFENIKQILKTQYEVKSKYILDKEQYKQKVGQEKEKKKQEKKRDKNVIPEQPQNDEENKAGKLPQGEKPEGQQNKNPKFKNKIQQALAHLDDEQDA